MKSKFGHFSSAAPPKRFQNRGITDAQTTVVSTCSSSGTISTVNLRSTGIPYFGARWSSFGH
jgi:hypothetical protein